MMIDLYETLLNGMILASVQNAGPCPLAPAPDIFVETHRQKTHIRHDLTKEELKIMRTDTDLPYQMQNLEHVETGGMMQGDIRVKYEIAMEEMPGNISESCVRYQRVKVILELEPTIFIARDFVPNSCWYYEINQHEESHIDMDQIVIDKYSERIRDGLTLAFSLPEDNVSGPVGKADIPALKKDMGQAVMAMVDVMVRDMSRERQQKQQSVDSLSGYAYIMNHCYTGDNIIKVDP